MALFCLLKQALLFRGLNSLYDVAVVGAGPAGIAASIFLKRAGFDIVLFEKNEIGGLLLNAHLVENYPGFPRGIKGYELCNLMKAQLSRWNIRPIKEEVNEINVEDDGFVLTTNDSQDKFRCVILATGTKPKKLGIPGETKLFGKSVFYDVKDLLPLIKLGDSCIVIGGSDAAFDYSLNLVEKQASVKLFYRSDKPKCLPLLLERVKKSSNIQLNPLSTLIELAEKDGKTEVLFDSKNSLVADYVLIACGREPNEELLSENFMEKNISGFYIAGDIKTGKFRQTGIAVGEGIHAAMSVEEYLRGKKE